MKKRDLTCFKAYDVRGELGVNFDSGLCFDIGRAFADVFDAKNIVVGFDARTSSPELSKNIIEGILTQGSNVFYIGMSGTEEVYWATTFFKACGGIQVTASHNPINFNGLKFVKAGSKPLEPKNEMQELKNRISRDYFKKKKTRGKVLSVQADAKKSFIKKTLGFVDVGLFKPLKVVVNSGNGASGPTFEMLKDEIEKINSSIQFFHYNKNPDGKFPSGIPNPLLKENQAQTRQLVKQNNGDLGVAFDGDFDRCFFFDNQGSFISSEYISGLLAQSFLEKEPFSNIVCDSRIIWNIEDIVKSHDGKFILSKTGHSFLKKTMRKHNAIYGSELSAHHYFRDFSFCDSGMITFLLIVELLSKRNIPIAQLIKKRALLFPSLGELNFEVQEPLNTIKRVKDFYRNKCISMNTFDGLIVTFDSWRFSLRISNTEKLLRLNLESKKGRRFLDKKCNEVINILKKVS